jgi:steroid 5-alpha reductase family enzyme
MNEGVKKYIEQRIPNAYFSETLFISNAAGVTTAAMQDFREQGAVLILVSTISLSVPAGAGTFSITDQFGRVIYLGAVQVENSGDYQRQHFIQAGFLRIATSTITVGFTVGFQFITYPDTVPVA